LLPASANGPVNASGAPKRMVSCARPGVTAIAANEIAAIVEFIIFTLFPFKNL
jgi:hypothetical protein